MATSGISQFYEIFSNVSGFFHTYLVVKSLEQLKFYSSPITPSHFLLRPQFHPLPALTQISLAIFSPPLIPSPTTHF